MGVSWIVFERFSHCFRLIYFNVKFVNTPNMYLFISFRNLKNQLSEVQTVLGIWGHMSLSVTIILYFTNVHEINAMKNQS